MAYFKINGNDYSKLVSSLKIGTSTNFNAQTNAAGDTVVDYINRKKVIEVGIIPLQDGEKLRELLSLLEEFNVSVSFRSPLSAEEEIINCIIPSNDIEYYYVRSGSAMYKAFNLKFTEL